MNDKIIQIILPLRICYAFEDGKASPNTCLALVELSNGDRRNSRDGYFQRWPHRGCVLYGCSPAEQMKTLSQSGRAALREE